MPRKHRLEFPGACYHVINRGNYRSNIFNTERAKAAFETCLLEGCEAYGWRVHAFVIMRNHFHLALETPKGNLVQGMQWLQATFANRFNRFRNERGHLFQGRYKALVIEPGSPLGQVCDYINLNPVRAGVCKVENLGAFRYNSYWYLHNPKQRPEFMSPETGLAEAGGLSDTPAGRRSYADYLEWQVAVGPSGKSNAYVNLSKGWALGTDGFKAKLLKSAELPDSPRAWGISGAKELKIQRLQTALRSCLRRLRKSENNLLTAPKSASWKVAIARILKERAQASNRWLGETLHMGRPEAVSTYVGRMKRGVVDATEYEQLRTTIV